MNPSKFSRIFSAPPGYFLLEVTSSNKDDVAQYKTAKRPIIAWGLHPDEFDPIPITLSGAPEPENVFTFLLPDGSVYEPYGGEDTDGVLYASESEWFIAACAEIAGRKEEKMIATIQLSDAELLRHFEDIKSNQKYSFPPVKRSAMANAAGHIIMAVALGFKVTHAKLTRGLNGDIWDCVVDLDKPILQVDECTEDDRRLMLLKAAMYFMAGHAGELYEGVTPADSSLLDRFRSELLSAYLDRVISLPAETIFYRASALASNVIAKNFGVFAGILAHLEVRDYLTEADLNLCVPAIELENVSDLLGGLQ